MAAWRMAMRGWYNPADGTLLDHPREMWSQCFELGVAAITYDDVQDDDFTKYSRDNPPDGWSKLASSRKHSLSCFIYQMQVGDVIYVKQAGLIIGRGVVASDYHFDLVGPIPGDLNTKWRHQRRVGWCRNFEPRTVSIGNTQRPTIVSLTAADVARVETTEPD